MSDFGISPNLLMALAERKGIKRRNLVGRALSLSLASSPRTTTTVSRPARRTQTLPRSHCISIRFCAWTCLMSRFECSHDQRHASSLPSPM
jgi:hypothetical protein